MEVAKSLYRGHCPYNRSMRGRSFRVENLNKRRWGGGGNRRQKTIKEVLVLVKAAQDGVYLKDPLSKKKEKEKKTILVSRIFLDP